MIVCVKENDIALLASLPAVNESFSMLLCKIDTLLLVVEEIKQLPSPYIPVLF